MKYYMIVDDAYFRFAIQKAVENLEAENICGGKTCESI